MDALIDRWRANTAAAGIRLDESDITRSSERGALNGIVAVEAILARIDARQQVPDYLGTLAVADEADVTSEAANG